VLVSGRSDLSPIAIDQVTARSKDLGVAVATRLAARVKRLSVPGELRHVDALGTELWDLVSHASLTADLFVCRHPNADTRREWLLVAEAALFGSARGIYFAERPADAGPMFQSVIVAWDGSRGATRALTEALPFLRRAQRTQIVTVNYASAPEPPDIIQGDDLVRHLAHSGVASTHRTVKALGRSVSEVLVQEIADLDADLLVMGAYGHSRAREWMFGGVTRDFLAHSPVPVLMAR
jgi:nucleotide-binding universal stress UspA family protein